MRTFFRWGQLWRIEPTEALWCCTLLRVFLLWHRCENTNQNTSSIPQGVHNQQSSSTDISFFPAEYKDVNRIPVYCSNLLIKSHNVYFSQTLGRLEYYAGNGIEISLSVFEISPGETNVRSSTCWEFFRISRKANEIARCGLRHRIREYENLE